MDTTISTMVKKSSSEIMGFILDFPLNTTINFSWEKENNSYRDYILLQAIEVSKVTEILVVIGYSFPLFNMIDDSKLMETMRDNYLRKIYYVDPFSDGKFLYSYFGLDPNKISIEHVSDVTNYFIPRELYYNSST